MRLYYAIKNSASRRRSWGYDAGGGKFYTHKDADCLATILTREGSVIIQ